LVERTGPTSIARQLYDLLRGQIEEGELRPGDRLPTELELCARHGISRTPVRSALGRLTEEGWVTRTPGRGTFVREVDRRERAAAPSDLVVTLPDERWCWPLQRAAACWNQEHPGQQARLTFRIVGLDRLRPALGHAVASGDAGDIGLVDSAWVAEFASRGYVLPLDIIAPPLAAGIAADLLPPLRAENSYRGQLYALPVQADLSVLWYRHDWFAAERLAPPTTWDEWLRAAQHFARRDVRARYQLGPSSLAFSAGAGSGETTTYQLLPLLWSTGADVIADHAVALNSVAAVRAVSFVRDLVRVHGVASPDVVHMPWNGAALALAAGSVALALGGTYESGLIRSAAGWDEQAFQERIGFVPIPAGPHGNAVTLIGGMSYAIFRQSPRARLALELLVCATRPDVLAEFGMQTGQNPPTRSATLALRDDREPFLASTSRLIDHARARWPLPEYARVSHQIARMFEVAILGDLRPAEAVARAAAVIAGITGLPEQEGVQPWPVADGPVSV
jgi:ABC-type glycerol-3-phosphate transport system substrate-binding protein